MGKNARLPHSGSEDSLMDAQDLQRSLLRVVHRTRAIDVRHYEWREQTSLQEELLPAVVEALSDAINVFKQILEYYGSPRADEAADARSDTAVAELQRGIGPPNEAGGEIQRITDLSFMARWELHREVEGLEKIKSSREPWVMISESGRACNRLVTSAIAVENAICASEGLSRILTHLYHGELNRSLQVRRAYAEFRQTVAAGGPAALENVRERLRGAVIGIAQLVGSDIYRDFRASDRRRIESLQSRLIEWLDATQEEDALAGLRLWQDVATISELLLEVNKRAELREHDQAMAAMACARLFHADDVPTAIPSDLDLRLQSLFGRDEELDHLIADPASHAIEEWRVPLERLVESLSPTKKETDRSHSTPESPLSSR